MDTGRIPPRLVHRWVLVAVVLTAGASVVYAVGQQAARAAIDDAPRALLEQTRGLLASGVPPAVATAGPTVKLTSSNAPFVIVYDARHSVVASSAELAGTGADVPPGVLDDAVAHGEDRVTWQPASEIREAVVASPWQSGTSRGVVVTGTSLMATENRTGDLRDWVGLSWLVAELASFGLIGRAALRSMRREATA